MTLELEIHFFGSISKSLLPVLKGILWLCYFSLLLCKSEVAHARLVNISDRPFMILLPVKVVSFTKGEK